MLHAVIAGFILSVIYKLLDKKFAKNEDFHVEVDWWLGFALIFVSSIIIGVLTGVVVFTELPYILIAFTYLIYILVPFLVLKFMLEYKIKKAIIYSVFLPVAVIITEFLNIWIISLVQLK